MTYVMNRRPSVIICIYSSSYQRFLNTWRNFLLFTAPKYNNFRPWKAARSNLYISGVWWRGKLNPAKWQKPFLQVVRLVSITFNISVSLS